MKRLNLQPRYSLFAMLAVTGTLAVVRVWSGQSIGTQRSPLSVAQMRDGASSASLRVQRVGEVPPDIRDSRGDLHVQFVNETRGWLSAGKKFWRTEDGGKHWLFVYDASPDSIRQFEFIDAVTGWMITTARLHGTKDGGSTWTVCSQPIRSDSEGHISAFRFLKEGRLGWIAGGLYMPIASGAVCGERHNLGRPKPDLLIYFRNRDPYHAEA